MIDAFSGPRQVLHYGQRGIDHDHCQELKRSIMKTPAQTRSIAISLLCAIGLSMAASAAHAASPVSDLARLDGSIGHLGVRDPYSEGARIGNRDPFVEGARIGNRDPYSEGANLGTRDPYSEGARIGGRDGYTEGA